jgi:hypothetical protein
VIFVNGVPFLNSNLLCSCAGLRGDQAFQIAYCIVRLALNPNLTTFESEMVESSQSIETGHTLGHKPAAQQAYRGKRDWMNLPSLSLRTTSIILKFRRFCFNPPLENGANLSATARADARDEHCRQQAESAVQRRHERFEMRLRLDAFNIRWSSTLDIDYEKTCGV